MKYAIEYRVPDPYDTGTHDVSSYLLVNSAGYYDIENTTGPIRKVHRKNGRLDFLLCYVHEGSMRVVFDNREQTVSRGVFICKPHAEDYHWQVNRDNFSIYWVHFTGYGANELMEKASLGQGGVFNTGLFNDLLPVFENMIREIGSKNPGYELLSSSLLMFLISLISRRMSTLQQDIRNNFDPRILNVTEYIRKHYQEQISVADLAAIAELSPSHLARLFKQHTGIYPLQYIINYRLQKACDLMLHTNLSIKQVSSYVGFEDQLYFSRLFKKHKGVSPADYLKQLRYSTFFIPSPEEIR